MKLMFVNYISNKTPPILIREYLKQHRIFATSMIAKQPDGISALVSGEEDETKFIEALTRLREIKEKYTDFPILYLDNDCIILNPVDSLFTDYDFDVAVIYRYNWVEHGGHQDCLGGFLFFSNKRPEVENRFLDKLIEKTKERYDWEVSEEIKPWYYDQLAINDLVGRPPVERKELEYVLAKPYEPCLKDVDGVKVLFLSANEWACPMTVNLPKNGVKLLHYNHAQWPVKIEKSANGKSVLGCKIQPTSTVPEVQ